MFDAPDPTPPSDDPVAFLAGREGALAVITGTEGASYKPVGTLMAFGADGARTGSLSSGCVEGALAAEAEVALADGRPRTLRYGRGSPFIDVTLPCGAGLDVSVLPRPERAVLRESAALWRARRAHELFLDPARGTVSLSGGPFRVRRTPPLRLVLFGRGPETVALAQLARGGGLTVEVLSPDEEVLAAVGGTALSVPTALPPFEADPQTALVTLFHDHDWEPAILESALAGPAFWVGAQGSARAQDARRAALAARGVTADALARLRGPIGLIPSARDPLTLAVSVLAEAMAAYKDRFGAHP